ncbi:MAG TPA: AAA family ATPase, partial [Chloroflexia bacterium]
LPPTLKSQSLLAYLILQRARPQPRERLIGMYWPEHPEERARRSLTTALWHIRRCLPDDGLLSDTQQVQFNPALALWLDVDEFRARAAQNNLDSLAAAGRLYRGDFLDGFYDDWIVEERNRLLDVLVAALGRLAAGYEQAGAAGAALDAALRLLAQEPLQEEAHRLVMRAYCRLGRRGRALEQYERCRDELRQELDTDPAPETIALYRAILDGSFAAGPVAPAGILPAAEPPARPAPGARHPLEGLTPGRMVGREADLAAIAARWRDACAGHGGLLLIEGEAGVGKSRLVEEFARQVERWDLPVLRGRCFEFERSLPYQPFPDLMHTGLQLMAPRALAACPPWALAEAARLAPELAETARAGAGTEPAPAALGAATDPERLFEGLLRFFIALAAGKPLLIILDDLHWAGRSCLQLIHFLTRHIATQPILLAGTFRPEALAPRHPLVALQRDLQTEGLGAVQPLLPLPRAAVETMVRELSGNAEAAAPLAARLCDETEGNPFFLIELLRALVEAGVIRVDPQTWQIDLARLGHAGRPLPAGVAQAIQARTAGLTTPAREALQYAAVLGQEFDFAALERMWGHGEEATLAALDQLLRRRMLLESSGSLSRDYSFTHKLIQEAVVAGLSRRTRLHLHALAAAALEQVYAGQLAAMAGELGFHYRQAQEHDPAVAGKAVAYLILAGDRARDVDMLREAIDYYEQALGLLRAQPPGEQAARVCMKLGLVRHWLRD